MEPNPYQAPRATDRAPVATGSQRSRSWFELLLAGCCLCIALGISGMLATFIASDLMDFDGAALWLFSVIVAFSLMAAGLFSRSNRVVWAGFLLFMLPTLALIAYAPTR
jgi:hypothetical protein